MANPKIADLNPDMSVGVQRIKDILGNPAWQDKPLSMIHPMDRAAIQQHYQAAAGAPASEDWKIGDLNDALFGSSSARFKSLANMPSYNVKPTDYTPQ